ncbi:SUF system Fe-S cluster assembly regulator [uncultured Amphritea sp.]|uniref:SUF system Fe-S cluster assembly regulator n=1 Tax=Amphritea sp. TaxID=1872502 RepID=UPI0025DC9C27|nr:SUF system Fe-S cluster assembly regulator [uncultured Amphritea sp.]
MLRISKFTDYGTVILALMAHNPASTHSAASVTRQVGLPGSTVSKLLKMMSRSGLLTSCRGKQGGYTLAKAPQEISLAEVIEALEGPIGITECSRQNGLCQVETHCAIRRQWQGVNGVIHNALQQVSLATLLHPPAVTEAEAIDTSAHKEPCTTERISV